MKQYQIFKFTNPISPSQVTGVIGEVNTLQEVKDLVFSYNISTCFFEVKDRANDIFYADDELVILLETV